MNLLESIEQGWLSHCHDGFPRKLGFPHQQLCKDREDFLTQVWQFTGWVDVYVSVFPDSLKMENAEGQRGLSCNKIYIDIDNEDLEKAHQTMQTLCNTIKRCFGSTPRTYFSGSRGFALYVDISPVALLHYTYTAREMVRRLMVVAKLSEHVEHDEHDWGDVDPSVFETERISRLPYTINMKSKRMCYPIDPKWELSTILQGSKPPGVIPEPIEINPLGQDFSKILSRIDTEDYQDYQENQVKKYAHHDSQTLEDDVQLIMRIAPYLRDGRTRFLWAMIIPRLVTSGKSRKEIHEYCKLFIEATGNEFDYKRQRFVDQQINYRNRGVIPWGWGAFFHHYPDLQRVFNAAVKAAEAKLK